jgi:hypothetical protein
MRRGNPSWSLNLVRSFRSLFSKPPRVLRFILLENETTDSGRRQTINVHEKWSTAIVKEVMEAAGGVAWQQYKVEAEAAGREVIPGEAGEKRVLSRKTKGALPGLDEFRAAKAKTTATPSKAVPAVPPETISQTASL